jgi:hypothetical protein
LRQRAGILPRGWQVCHSEEGVSPTWESVLFEGERIAAAPLGPRNDKKETADFRVAARLAMTVSEKICCSFATKP